MSKFQVMKLTCFLRPRTYSSFRTSFGREAEGNSRKSSTSLLMGFTSFHPLSLPRENWWSSLFLFSFLFQKTSLGFLWSLQLLRFANQKIRVGIPTRIKLN